MRGVTQADLAAKSGVSASAIAEYESDKRDLRGATLHKLCEALGVQITYAVDGIVISGGSNPAA